MTAIALSNLARSQDNRTAAGSPATDPREIEAYFDRLWPILRSITGSGVRQTHDILGELVPLERIEIPSGTRCFDWTVPKEWVVREAYVIAPDGRRMLDVRENTLHLVNYSMPFHGRLNRSELDRHLHSLPDMPEAIPYVTSYYAPRWGFCLPHRLREALPEGEYEVVVDTEHVQGALTISEAFLPGDEREEVLFSTYTCHPSLANNELSGPVVIAFLHRRLAALPRRRLSYRFVFLPETIGSIAFLARRGEHLRQHLAAGYVVTCVGDDGPFTYKRSRRGDTLADRAALWTLPRLGHGEIRIIDFRPDQGSDERQYCSPGFDLPVGSIMRTPYGAYPEYHTSLDDRSFVSFAAMARSVDAYFEVCRTLEMACVYDGTVKYGEPQLGRRGLYPTLGAAKEVAEETSALLWLINYCDGQHDLLDIAERSGHDLSLLHELAQRCLTADLLVRCPEHQKQLGAL